MKKMNGKYLIGRNAPHIEGMGLRNTALNLSDAEYKEMIDNYLKSEEPLQPSKNKAEDNADKRRTI